MAIVEQHTEAFARFILECRDAFGDLCTEIEEGRVPPGRSAKFTIEFTAGMVDQIRRDVAAQRN